MSKIPILDLGRGSPLPNPIFCQKLAFFGQNWGEKWPFLCKKKPKMTFLAEKTGGYAHAKGFTSAWEKPANLYSTKCRIFGPDTPPWRGTVVATPYPARHPGPPEPQNQRKNQIFYFFWDVWKIINLIKKKFFLFFLLNYFIFLFFFWFLGFFIFFWPYRPEALVSFMHPSPPFDLAPGDARPQISRSVYLVTASFGLPRVVHNFDNIYGDDFEFDCYINKNYLDLLFSHIKKIIL